MTSNRIRHFTCPVDEPWVAVLVGQLIGQKIKWRKAVKSGKLKEGKELLCKPQVITSNRIRHYICVVDEPQVEVVVGQRIS